MMSRQMCICSETPHSFQNTPIKQGRECWNNGTNVSIHFYLTQNIFFLFVPSCLLPALNCTEILGVFGYKAAAVRKY